MVHFVIVGGSFGAVGALKAITSVVPDAKVTVVSTSSHAFYNIAAPRLIVKPDLIDETLFNVGDTVAKYGNNSKFVHGEVVGVDIGANKITVQKESGEETIGFDYLVLATGSRTVNEVFKGGKTAAEVKERIARVSREAKQAKKIVIIGGGATGVELAGELGEHYGSDKEIVIYTGEKYPLPMLDSRRGNIAQHKLEALKVRVVNDVWLDTVEQSGNEYQLNFKNGTTETTDYYINATGVIPNTEYLDPDLLDKRGKVLIDENLHLKGYTNVYALGDIVSDGNATLVDLAYTQLPSFQAALKHDVVDPSSAYKPYKLSPKLTLVAPISSSGGMGVLNDWGLPNFMVRMVKSKDFMIGKAKDSLN
jgi:NADH dehydrogenase FAD-containing subunit